MKKTKQILILLMLITPMCFAEQENESTNDEQLTHDDAWGRLAQPVHPHTRWETYSGPPWGYNYQPNRWSSPPVRPPWQNPYPPSRWYTEPNQVPAENPYPPRRWLPPPRGPQWVPPPPTYQHWNPAYQGN